MTPYFRVDISVDFPKKGKISKKISCINYILNFKKRCFSTQLEASRMPATLFYLHSKVSKNLFIKKEFKRPEKSKHSFKIKTLFRHCKMKLNCKIFRDFFNPLKDGLLSTCVPEKGRRIAFILPFRDDGSKTRTTQFFWLLNTYLPLFIKQRTEVQFFIINQG